VRTLAAALLLAVSAAGQQPRPGAIIRGKLLECDSTAATGELSVRSPDNEVFRLRFDAHTYFERSAERISAAKLRTGDTLEIVSDSTPGGAMLYARTIHVLEPERPPSPRTSYGRVRMLRNPIEHIAPSGNLTLSGLVAKLNDQRIVLRTRSEGEKLIYLRADTRFLESGSPVGISSLKPNTRVFVRGSKNIDDEIEAYQVIWGEILDPRR